MRSASILITGASGFVGSALVRHFAVQPDKQVRAAVRQSYGSAPDNVTVFPHGPLELLPSWKDALLGVDTVIHCAATVHVIKENSVSKALGFKRVNVDSTLDLARQAAAAGVGRFIFMSSIKVNGEFTIPAHPFTADEAEQPSDPYGLSKWQAERGLRVLAAQSGMDVVIIRPVLVYGPGVKANFQSLISLVDKGFPIPFGRVDNLRSFVGLDNLVDFIDCCVEHPLAANQTFVISDGRDLSTPDLIRLVANTLGKNPRLVNVPVSLMHGLAACLGKAAVADRLFGSLQVDTRKNHELLGWVPAFTMEDLLVPTIQYYRTSKLSN